ncbi:MAG: beta-propeller fold lactonase family protein [bacterium]
MNKQPLILFSAVLFFTLFTGATSAHAATVSTYLGKVFLGDGQQAMNGYLDMPRGLAVASNKTIYIADTVNNIIRTISPSGILNTYSGTGEYGVKDGARRTALWSEPEGIAIDRAGTIYIADTGSNTIRKITKNAVTTIVKSGLKNPSGIAVVGTKLYIADTGNNRIVTTTTRGGSLTVLAKNISSPNKLIVVGKMLYTVSPTAGTLTSINLTTKKKRTLAKGFIEPRSISSVNGSLIVAAGASGIWNELWSVAPASGKKVKLITRRETEWLNQTSDLALTTINGEQRLLLLQQGGSSLFSVNLQGEDLVQIAGKHRFQDEMGSRSTAQLGRPKALAFSPDKSRLYISYANSNKIAVMRMKTGQVSVLAGYAMDNYREGTGTDARFSDISALVVSPDGKTLYVADRNNQRIRTVNVTTGETSYLIGAGIVNLISDTNATEQIDQSYKNGYKEGGACPDVFTSRVAGCAYFDRPTGLALTKDGKTLYVADASNNRIRKINLQTKTTALIAGSGKAGFVNGVGKKAVFNGPSALALSRDGKSLFVTDKYNHTIRQIVLATKTVTTLAGDGRPGYREGIFGKARFSIPEFLTTDAKGNLYVTESGGLRIRKLDLTRRTTSLVSGSGIRGNRNGAAPVARWNNPKGIVIFGSRALVADSKNDLIRILSL